MSRVVAGELLARARAVGWKQAYFELGRELAAGNELPPEDARSADWFYFLDASAGARALVIGCGFGTIPIALAEAGLDVWVIDSSIEHLALLALRCREQSVGRVHIAGVGRVGALPFQPKSFDVVCVLTAEPEPVTAVALTAIMRATRDCLKPGGEVFIAQRNRWSFQRLLRPWLSHGAAPLGPSGYRRLVESSGFSDVLLYAPLPRHGEIPLFYVPIENPSVLSFFLRDIFPLFNTVSPEVKGRFGLEYAAARYGSFIVRHLGLARLARHFVPGVCIIATRAEERQHVA